MCIDKPGDFYFYSNGYNSVYGENSKESKENEIWYRTIKETTEWIRKLIIVFNE